MAEIIKDVSELVIKKEDVLNKEIEKGIKVVANEPMDIFLKGIKTDAQNFNKTFLDIKNDIMSIQSYQAYDMANFLLDHSNEEVSNNISTLVDDVKEFENRSLKIEGQKFEVKGSKNKASMLKNINNKLSHINQYDLNIMEVLELNKLAEEIKINDVINLERFKDIIPSVRTLYIKYLTQNSKKLIEEANIIFEKFDELGKITSLDKKQYLDEILNLKQLEENARNELNSITNKGKSLGIQFMEQVKSFQEGWKASVTAIASFISAILSSIAVGGAIVGGAYYFFTKKKLEDTWTPKDNEINKKKA